MDRHEQIGLLLARDLVATIQRDEEIAITRQHRLHAGLGVDARGQRLGNGQGDVLLARTVRPGRPGVVAAMASIDRHHDLALAAGDAKRIFVLDHARRVGAIEQIDDQTMPELVGGRQQETLGLHAAVQIEHDAQAVGALTAGAHALDHALEFAAVERLRDAAVRDVEHQSIRVGQREQLVVDRPADIEDDARMVVRIPEPHRADITGQHRFRTECEQEKTSEADEACEHDRDLTPDGSRIQAETSIKSVH